MRIFEPIIISWGDSEYTIDGDDKIMKLIAQIESEVTLQNLATGTATMTAVSRAYFKALKFAGCDDVTVAEVYRSLFKNSAEGLQIALTSLMAMMVPPEEMQQNAPKKSVASPKKA